jgi:hypothetical protein
MTTIVAHEEIAFRCNCDTDTHGGLTPAALGGMCVCASQKSFFRRQTFAMQQEPGTLAPVVSLDANAPVIGTRTLGGLA